MLARAKISLQNTIEQLAVPGILIGHRVISGGDEHTLRQEETPVSPLLKARRESGAARIVARELIARAGYRACTVPRAESGAPLWPDGLVGSLAHDSCIAVAAVAARRQFATLGIDIEPAEPLPDEIVEFIATPAEQASLASYLYGGRLLFVAKEAVYKAIATLNGMRLDHRDIEIDLTGNRALVRNAAAVELRLAASDHLLALAFIGRSDVID